MADLDHDNNYSYSPFVLHRLLGPAAEPTPPTVDYAVVGVIVITLGLVLVIEVLRQKLDAATSGHSFSKVVVELMYRELTTLGIVEFWIYLLHKYWAGFNYNLEVIFVDVHFMLFYTAVFNAIQCGLVRLVTSHRTNKAWMQTEDIDIDHYVAIRKEFDRVESTIRETCHFMPNEDAAANRMSVLQEVTKDLAFKLRFPRLHRKRKRLLTPIRFHELRAHFIDANNLPPKFRVSRYLKRCLSSVLIDLVHISPAAWIMLMATADILFYVMGMIFNVTGDAHEVELCLVSVVIGFMVVFLVFGFVLYFRMKFIFFKILHMKLTIFDANLSIDKTFRFTALASFSTEAIDQKKLFWGSNPRIIIVVIQFMQFGYALTLAIIFTFHKQLNTSYTVFDPEYIILGIMLSYLVFLHLVSTILPWYTLCTSLGQLVKKDRLHETLAKLKLSDEIRMKESLEEERKVEEEIERRKNEADAENAKALALSEERKRINDFLAGIFRRSKDGSDLQDSARLGRVRRMKSTSDNVASMRAMVSNFSDYVSQDSVNPMQLTEDDHTSQSITPEQPKSPGSPGLRRMNTMTDLAHPKWFEESPHDLIERQAVNERRRRRKCQSEGVFNMRLSNKHDMGLMLLHDTAIRKGPEKLAALAELTKLSAEELPEIPKFSNKDKTNKVASDNTSSDDVEMSNGNKTGFVGAIKSSFHDIVATGGFITEPSTKMTPKATRGITFSEHDTGMKENGSINRTVSDDDDSDIDDVPEATTHDGGASTRQGGLLAIAKNPDIAAFFESMQYRTVSLICGPMACFFFISRVQVFNTRAGYFVDRTYMWHKYQGVFFWLEITTFCIMITEMLLVLVVFLSRRGRDGSFFACAAAVFGLLINVVCLSLFLIAETKRCCEDNNPNTNIFTRLLGPDSTEYDGSSTAEIINCCPAFGTRTYGGLGTIEPFTALILLVPLRFLVASFIVKIFGTSQADECLQNAEAMDQDHETDPTIKVRELWMAAVGAHNDVAQKYGLFSGELLQCMLGIYNDEIHVDTNELETSARDADSVVDNDNVSNHETIHRDTTPTDASSRFLVRTLKSPIGRQQSGNFDGWCDDFEYPKARLLRRMRRCERQFLPLLDEWIVVDVVVTSHELVLFDVLDKSSEQNGLGREPIPSSLDNGGKGSYLCDVAKGRNVVSKFNIQDVLNVCIDHWVAKSSENDDSDDIEGDRKYSLQEYWQRGGNSQADYDAITMTKRWDHVNEDRLKIQFKHNSLLLRFMVDLKEMENEPMIPQDDFVVMSDIGTQTKVWCRTIARLRGITEEINFSAAATNPNRSVNRRMIAGNQRDLGASMSNSTNNLRRSVLRRSSVR